MPLFIRKQFVTKTNKKSLKELMNQIVQTSDQLIIYQNSFMIILFCINQVKTNKVADAILRRESISTSQLFILTTPSFEFLNTLFLENNSFPDL